ncbi:MULTISPECIES: hypothetical protein [unclassified Nocardioides]|jgi:hypothetical protein|uniref:hypothetical protein n=1 Tax=unclassified Nocardioides TaxID=2615069 RepID=UPI0012FCE6C9|nr:MULTISPECIES: hypothetical protein [unclassified Nocardioides]
MSHGRWRRKLRCLVKHGPRGCPHIERHSRRPRRKKKRLEASGGRHRPPVNIVSPADLVR